MPHGTIHPPRKPSWLFYVITSLGVSFSSLACTWIAYRGAAEIAARSCRGIDVNVAVGLNFGAMWLFLLDVVITSIAALAVGVLASPLGRNSMWRNIGVAAAVILIPLICTMTLYEGLLLGSYDDQIFC